MASSEGHPDPDDLALLAVEPDDPSLTATRSHVDACPTCADEVTAFAEVVAAARGEVGSAQRSLPGPSVWQGIAAATGVRSAPDPAAVLRSLDDDDAPGAARADVPSGASPGDLSREAAVVPAPRRRWSTRVLAGVAAVALVLGAAVGLAVGAATGGPSAGDGADGGETATETPTTPGTTVVAQAQLGPVPPDLPEGAGTAQVLEAGSAADDRRLVVDTRGLAVVEGAVHEVWLLDPTTGGLLSVGYLVDGASPAGGFALPGGVDLKQFTSVDVSAEPLDGDAGHSGNSELRGQLSTAAV